MFLVRKGVDILCNLDGISASEDRGCIARPVSPRLRKTSVDCNIHLTKLAFTL